MIKKSLILMVSLLAGNYSVSFAADTETAIFAGGCFWCVESDFDKVDGVISTVSGYTGGHTKDATYREVTAGGTGHREAVEIEFDPSVVDYGQLLDIFWRSVNPTDNGGQFCDRGESYTTAIFATSEDQKEAAERSKANLQTSGKLKKDIVTPVLEAMTFYPAEDYHQNYYKKNPVRYKFYRYRCGRDAEIAKVWTNS